MDTEVDTCDTYTVISICPEEHIILCKQDNYKGFVCHASTGLHQPGAAHNAVLKGKKTLCDTLFEIAYLLQCICLNAVAMCGTYTSICSMK